MQDEILLYIRKFKYLYFVIEAVQNRLSPEPLDYHYTVDISPQMFMLILKWILGLKSQSIDLKNTFAHAYILSGGPVSIELPRYFNSYGGQYDVVLRLNKILYGQAKSARIWYKIFLNGLLYYSFVVSIVDTCMFISKNVIFVVYVDDCLFWKYSQSDIDIFTKSLKEDGPSYNWEQ